MFMVEGGGVFYRMLRGLRRNSMLASDGVTTNLTN